MLKNIAFFIITLFTRLYVRAGILLTWGKHLHDSIISLRGDAWASKAILMPPLFNEETLLYQESERSCICVRDIYFPSFYDCSILFVNCSDM